MLAVDSTLDSQLSSLDSPAVLAPALRKTEVRRNPIPSGGRHGSRRWPQRRIFVDVCLSRDSRVPEGLSMLVTMRPHPPFASPHKRRRCPALLLMRSQQKPPIVQGLGKHCGGNSASLPRHPGETHPPSSQLTSTIHPRTLIQGVIQNAHSQYTEADFCLSISSSFTFLCTTNVAGELPQRSVDGVTSSGDICAPLFGVGTSNKAGGAEKRDRVSYRPGATALPAHPQRSSLREIPWMNVSNTSWR